MLDANPGAHEVVRELLGDSSMRTIRDYYAPTDTKRAVKFNDEVIAELREKARSSRPRKGTSGQGAAGGGHEQDQAGEGLWGLACCILPVEHWPPEDVVAFEAAFAKVADPFDPQGAGAHLAESTIFALRHAYRRWLGHLMLVEPEALALPPAERVTPDRVRSLVAVLRRSNTEYSVATVIDKFHAAISYMAPDQDWTWFKTMSKGLLRVARPQPKPVIPCTSAELQDVGLEMMKAGRQGGKALPGPSETYPHAACNPAPRWAPDRASCRSCRFAAAT